MHSALHGPLLNRCALSLCVSFTFSTHPCNAIPSCFIFWILDLLKNPHFQPHCSHCNCIPLHLRKSELPPMLCILTCNDTILCPASEFLISCGCKLQCHSGIHPFSLCFNAICIAALPIRSASLSSCDCYSLSSMHVAVPQEIFMESSLKQLQFHLILHLLSSSVSCDESAVGLFSTDLSGRFHESICYLNITITITVSPSQLTFQTRKSHHWCDSRFLATPSISIANAITIVPPCTIACPCT